ncbi:multiple epidermal growth factor-like domains protein 10 [Mercenaria mercenaria]|uniref:multiple epidermal growth factor-like domains protein 10 n=1 Tax=Mercenaria mercenaria TaxID=6596 RepID=UPI00234FA955|nr:multiple epidermal growth factor-like domains protein 10 [Mercenaria mercenaria]
MTELVNTSMSSTVHNWTSDHAIDGNVGPDPDVCNCCSGTQNSQISWWMVDMGKRFPVNLITVYSRRNEQTFQQLTDFQLYFANGTMAYSYVLIGNNTRKVLGSKHELTFPSVVTRYIKIQRPGILTLCEVRVYKGECPVGTFGDECLQRCHCADERACDAITGHCQSPACKTGWIGIACNKQCPQDTFGDKCTETCFCAEGTCTNNYGICHGKCRSGYTGSHCNEVEVIKTENKTDVRSSSEYRSAQIIGVAVGGSTAVLFVIVAISFIIYKYRKRNSTSDSKHDYATPDITHAQVETEYDTLDNLNDNQGQGNNSYENERVSAF